MERGKYISVLVLIFFLSCSQRDNEYVVEMISPVDPTNVTDSLVITLTVSEAPDSMHFSFLTSQIKLGSARSYTFEFNPNRIATGDYTAQSMFFWDNRQLEFVHNLSLNFPVIIGGVEIPEGRITRNHWGSVVEMNMSDMQISKTGCLLGIDAYCSRISRLNLSGNRLHGIELSALEGSEELRLLDLSGNNFLEIPQFTGKAIKINLSGNNITTINISIFEGMNVDTVLLLENHLSDETMADINIFRRAFKKPVILTDDSI